MARRFIGKTGKLEKSKELHLFFQNVRTKAASYTELPLNDRNYNQFQLKTKSKSVQTAGSISTIFRIHNCDENQSYVLSHTFNVMINLNDIAHKNTKRIVSGWRDFERLSSIILFCDNQQSGNKMVLMRGHKFDCILANWKTVDSCRPTIHSKNAYLRITIEDCSISAAISDRPFSLKRSYHVFWLFFIVKGAVSNKKIQISI